MTGENSLHSKLFQHLAMDEVRAPSLGKGAQLCNFNAKLNWNRVPKNVLVSPPFWTFDDHLQALCYISAISLFKALIPHSHSSILLQFEIKHICHICSTSKRTFGALVLERLRTTELKSRVKDIHSPPKLDLILIVIVTVMYALKQTTAVS